MQILQILQIQLKERISTKDSYPYASKSPPVNVSILLINIVRSFEIHSFMRTQEIRSVIQLRVSSGNLSNDGDTWRGEVIKINSG